MIQTTLNTRISCVGVGVHSGRPNSVSICPAEANTGYVFVRTDLEPKSGEFPASWKNVSDTNLATTLKNRTDATVSTVEHVLAALSGCGVDNARIEVSGLELPIMDGSARRFVDMIHSVGLKEVSAKRRPVIILQEVEVRLDDRWARLRPGPFRRFECTIDFRQPAIGRQSASIDLDDGSFVSEVAIARTFGTMVEAKALKLRRQGARGASLENTLLVDHNGILNPGGLRVEREFARHKLLDAIGDLALAGAPILGGYESFKPGHTLNNMLLRAVFSQKDSWYREPDPEERRVSRDTP